MVKPHHMMLGKRRHGHVFRILYVLRRKSIFEPHFTTRFFVKSVGGRRRRRDAVLTATQGLWSYHLKSAQWSEIDFESLKNVTFFFLERARICRNFCIFGGLITSFLEQFKPLCIGAQGTTSVGGYPKFFFWVCVVFSFWFTHWLIDTTRKCKCHKIKMFS